MGLRAGTGVAPVEALTVVLVLAVSAVLVVLMATVARRILDVPVGWPRSILVSLVVVNALGSMIFYVGREARLIDPGRTGADAIIAPLPVALMFFTLATFWVFALGVATLVVLEAIAPTGTLPSPLRMLSHLKARRRSAQRYAHVVAIVAKHGLGGFLKNRRPVEGIRTDAGTARALKGALNEAGPTYVKLGQMLSTRRDLLSDAFLKELSTLQTDAAPEPWARMEAVIVRSLGVPLAEVFELVEREPLASASVAQVHRGRLHDGTEVVLKIRRPGAAAQVKADLEIILRMARWLDRATSWGRALGVTGLAAGFAASLQEELDYTVELENMRNVQAALAPKSTLRIPHAYAEYSSPRLLVMQTLPGLPVGREAELLSRFTPEQRHDIAATLLAEVLHQIVGSGVFHADLHPGNVLIDEDGALGLTDFGSVGRLDAGSRQALGLFLYAMEKSDSLTAADALIELLGRPEYLDEREFERRLGHVLLRYRAGQGAGGPAGMFGALFRLVLNHGFSIQPEIAASFRALASLEGTLRLLSTEVDMVEVARIQGRQIFGAELRPGRIKDTLETQLISYLPILQRLPRRLNKITEDLEQGRFTVSIRALAHPEDKSFITGIIQQIVVAIIAGSATLGAIVLLTSDSGPMMTETVRLYAFFGYCLLFVGFVLALRSLVLVFRKAESPTHRPR